MEEKNTNIKYAMKNKIKITWMGFGGDGLGVVVGFLEMLGLKERNDHFYMRNIRKDFSGIPIIKKLKILS